MHEELSLKLSQLVDGELPADEALALLQSLQGHPEWAAAWRRYDAVSQALKSSAFISPSADFVERVSHALRDDPPLCCPQPLLRSRPVTNSHRLPKIAWSLAASILLGLGLWFALQQTALPPALLARLDPTAVPTSPPQKSEQRFHQYLEAHGANWYAGTPTLAAQHGQLAGYRQ